MTIRASRKPASGLNAESSRFTVTNSIEPAKMNALIHIGHTKEKPLVPMRMPYEAPRNRNPRQIGMVSGNAALSAGSQALVLVLAVSACTTGLPADVRR